MRLEPEALRVRPDGFALVILKQCFEVAEEVFGLGRAGAVLDVIGAVVVHAVEIVAALHEGFVLGRPRGKTVTELCDHGLGVAAKVDGVGEPGDGEFELAFAGFDVFGVGGVPRFDPVT